MVVSMLFTAPLKWSSITFLIDGFQLTSNIQCFSYTWIKK